MGTSWLMTLPATTGAVGTAGAGAEAASNGSRCVTTRAATRAATIAATANAEIAEMITLRRIGCSPTRRLRQQAPEDVDSAVLLVDGHGAGLRPGLLSSVEPIGIVGTPSCEVPLLEVGLLEALDCEDAVPPATGAWPHIL